MQKIIRLLYIFTMSCVCLNCQEVMANNATQQKRAFKGHMFFVWNGFGGYFFSYHPGVNRLVSRSEIKKLKIMSSVGVHSFFMENISPKDEIDVICIEDPASLNFTDKNVNIIRSCESIREGKELLLKLAKENNAAIHFRENEYNKAFDGF